MKLGSKIVLGFVATNIIYVVLSAFIFLSAQPVRQDSTILSQDLLPMLDQASQVQYSTAMEGYMTQEYSHTIDAEILVESLTYNADVTKFLGFLERNIQLSQALQTPAITEALKNVRRNYQDFRALAELLPGRLEVINSSVESVIYGQESFNAIISASLVSEEQAQTVEIASGASPDALEKRASRIGGFRTLENIGHTLVISVLRARHENNKEEFANAYKLIAQARQVTEELVAGGAGGSTLERLKTISAMLEEVEKTVRELESVIRQSDEDSVRRNTLADATIKQAAALREAGDQRSQRVASDSTRALERVIWSLAIGVVGVLVISLVMALTITRGITRPLNTLIGQLSDGATEVEQAAGALSGSSNELAAGARENAESLANTASALEELSSMTKRNADNSLEAHALMSQANEAVVEAKTSMNRVIKAMGEISSSGNEISKIIKTIDEIAFQTNLLALNAAVEAARAGEAGAGFAVVADEVRNLATRSAEAAKNTADLIASTITNINSGSEMVGLTAENFATVENHSGKVTELLGEVAEASKEQSAGITQINQAMNSMDQVTQSNSSSANESAQSAGNLSSQAANLLSAVDELTVMVHGQGAAGFEPSRRKGLPPSPARLKITGK